MNRYISYICLVVVFFGCEEVFIEKDLSEEEIQIIAPTEGATVENTTTTFSWEAVDQATSYQIQVAQPNFENAAQILVDSSVTGTSFSLAILKNDYEWRVNAQNSGSATPYASANFSVIDVADFSAREVLLVSPADNEITNDETTTLSWTAVTDATLYRVQFFDEDEELINEDETTDTDVSVTFEEGTTVWQVRAENDTQSTLYASRTYTLDTEEPNTPTLVSPTDESSQTDTTVTFGWTREEVDGTAEVDSIYVYSDATLTQLVATEEATSTIDIELTEDTTYYWFVQAFDEAGNESEASSTFSFTIN